MASVRENFPRNLDRLLRERDLTNTWLASKVGVSNATVTKWLQGKVAPELSRLDAIAEAFEVSYLVLLEDPERAAAPRKAPSAADVLREIARSLGYEIIKRRG
jgi:transcriptional regulator with XRE-family HTH domain